MSQFELLDCGDGEHVYSLDWIAEHGAPPRGVELRCTFTTQHLDTGICVADASSWTIPELGVTQDAWGHAGFRGTVAGLLQKTCRDIEMMRGGYPQSVQPNFDAFLSRCASILAHSSGMFEMVIRDPSGLSCVDADNVDDLDWVARRFFSRTWSEDEELGLHENSPAHSDDDDERDTTKNSSSVDAVADLLRHATRVVALTGAGISVESGVPPFRNPSSERESAAGAAAIWEHFDANQMTVQNFNLPADDPRSACGAWWKMKRELMPKIRAARPNPAHELFAWLEARGKLHTVITQNIDSLHQRSGVPPHKVLELHGHMRGLICSDHATPLNPVPRGAGTCTFRLSEDEMHSAGYFADPSPNTIPMCPKCAAPLRTETVFFGQPLPAGAMTRARDAIGACDLLVVVGSTLIVQPACELPGIALQRAVPLVLANLDSVTTYDRHASAVVREPAGAFFGEVMRRLACDD
eukprot:gnl/Spiro4/14890_TR8025_c0_g1_i1.p1 gnl/Spiro4/14890_TR8025_c0_g1~~gnl/Spiro4/14890_TR8025_c0_g1_i1.p1  ORF type:complete len:486 (+),score=139.28 gnl/Spiro4/14890_TR8025_c0_g1_i1:59-1459(+)